MEACVKIKGGPIDVCAKPAGLVSVVKKVSYIVIFVNADDTMLTRYVQVVYNLKL